MSLSHVTGINQLLLCVVIQFGRCQEPQLLHCSCLQALAGPSAQWPTAHACRITTLIDRPMSGSRTKFNEFKTKPGHNHHCVTQDKTLAGRVRFVFSPGRNLIGGAGLLASKTGTRTATHELPFLLINREKYRKVLSQ